MERFTWDCSTYLHISRRSKSIRFKKDDLQFITIFYCIITKFAKVMIFLKFLFSIHFLLKTLHFCFYGMHNVFILWLRHTTVCNSYDENCEFFCLSIISIDWKFQPSNFVHSTFLIDELAVFMCSCIVCYTNNCIYYFLFEFTLVSWHERVATATLQLWANDKIKLDKSTLKIGTCKLY